jgi:hypothetical protein
VKFHGFIAAAAVAGLCSFGATPALASRTSGKKCGNNACLTVWNEAPGSNFIDSVDVGNATNPGIFQRPCWTLSGFGVQACAVGYGTAGFIVNRRLTSGRCISGFVDGITGSAPCWIVP